MKTFPVGLDDETRARYQAAADAHGVSLAQWIRDCCAMRLRDGNKPVVEKPSNPGGLLGAGTFKGPDWKPEPKQKEKRR